MNTNFGRMEDGPQLEERDLGWKSEGPELVPRRLVRSTSVQGKNLSLHGTNDGHNLPTNTRKTGGLQQIVTTSGVFPVEIESPPQDITRSPFFVNSHTRPPAGSPGSPRESPRLAKPKGWIRRLSMPVLSSLDSSKKADSPTGNDSSQAWRSSLALPETSTRYRKTSLDTLGSRSNKRR